MPHTKHAPRISPAGAAESPTSDSGAPSSPMSWIEPKKSRFRRRKRTSSNTAPTCTPSLSSSQISVDDSSTRQQQPRSATSTTASTKKRKGLLMRLLKYTGTASSHKSKLVIETKPSGAEKDQESNTLGFIILDGVHQVDHQLVALEQRGLEERQAGNLEQAMDTWKEALTVAEALSSSHATEEDAGTTAVDRLAHQIKCRLISLHLQMYQQHHENDDAEQSALHLEQGNSLIAELEPLDDDDGSALGLEGSSLLLDMLMNHSCWSLALQVSHTMPNVHPLKLARLHLEVALEGAEEVVETYRDELQEEESITDDPLLGEKRFQQLVHLSECHQLLLAFDTSEASDDDARACNTLWQELAQTYGYLGEDDLALGCSLSRLQHLTSPLEVALAHYDQALNVLSPVGQYELALKEAELALHVLQRDFDKSTDTSITASSVLVEQKECLNEGEDADLLWMKLYQFKADVLCRLGRIDESIQCYEMLLRSYDQSTNHGPADSANLLYILGKLSVRAKRYTKALEYFDQEVAMTKTIVGPHHMAVAKILHESARVADAGMMDYPRAVRYYQEALQVEKTVYQHCKQQLQESGNASLATVTLMQEARAQIGETKQCLGKLHFKMGDFTTAMKTTLSLEK